MLILLVGKSGVGKSSLGKYISNALNYDYIECDLISHEIFNNKEFCDKTIKIFGKQILNNNVIDRKKIGEIVFSNKHSFKVKRYYNLSNKYITDAIDSRIKNDCVLDWYFLPGTKYWKMKNIKILIETNNNKLRKELVIKRDNISEEYFEKRDSTSLNYYRYKLDCVLCNDYSKNFFSNANALIKEIIDNYNKKR